MDSGIGSATCACLGVAVFGFGVVARLVRGVAVVGMTSSGTFYFVTLDRCFRLISSSCIVV